MAAAAPSILTRKEQRKQARHQKKQNRAQNYSRRSMQKVAAQTKPTTDTRRSVKFTAPPPAKRQRIKAEAKIEEEEDDEEIDSDELDTSRDDSDEEHLDSSTEEEEEVTSSRKFKKGFNRYGTEDPILAAAEEALDNGLFDSEGNIDEDGFEGLFGSKFEEQPLSGTDEEDVTISEATSEPSEDSEESDVELEEEKTKEIKVVPVPKKAEEPTEQKLQLFKKIKGLLNRLSQSNFESIAVSIEAIYKDYPRREVTEVITDLVLAAITNQGNLLDSFVLVFASLVATLSHLIGIEFGAYLLQRIVEVLSENNAKRSSEQASGNGESITPERIVINLVTFLSFLYDLQIVSNRIIGDLIMEAVTRLNELDTEIILKLVRNCGAQFRRDDPSTLKDIIIKINERVLCIPKESQSSRFKFMLESIYDLKNNKQKFASIQLGELETSKKLLRNMAQQRSIAKFEPLRIGLEDIRNADTRGRWWLVGGTWAPDVGKKVKAEKQVQVKNEIAALAKEQHMNTDVRKAIFSALVSSEDYLDAFQRLLNLKLTSKQERDIPAVILHCCGQEKIFNPFYSLVGQKIVAFKHNHLITFKYFFWDWLKQIEEAPLRKISHLASFYASLLGKQSLPLSIVKKADFLHLSEKEALFFQMLFSKLLLETSEEILSAIFEQFSTLKKRAKAEKRTKAKDVFGGDFEGEELSAEEEEEEQREGKLEDLGPIKAAIQIFFTFYLREKSGKDLPFVKDHGLLRKRLNFVQVYL